MEIKSVTKELAATAADIEALCLDTAWSASQIAAAEGSEDTLYLVATEKGVPCGVISCVFSRFEAMVENLAVLPRYRRTGTASALLAEVERRARARGLEAIALEVASRNTGAVLLYEKAGFAKAGVRKGFYAKQRDDALIMIKEIL